MAPPTIYPNSYFIVCAPGWLGAQGFPPASPQVPHTSATADSLLVNDALIGIREQLTCRWGGPGAWLAFAAFHPDLESLQILPPIRLPSLFRPSPLPSLPSLPSLPCYSPLPTALPCSCRYPYMHLHSVSARPGCIILELDVFGPIDARGREMHPEGMEASALLDLMNVQSLLQGGGQAISVNVRMGVS